MIITCEYCKTKHLIDDESLVGKTAFSFNCINCHKKNSKRQIPSNTTRTESFTIKCPNCNKLYRISAEKGEQFMRFVCQCGEHFDNPRQTKSSETTTIAQDRSDLSDNKKIVAGQNISSVISLSASAPKTIRVLKASEISSANSPNVRLANQTGQISTQKPAPENVSATVSTEKFEHQVDLLAEAESQALDQATSEKKTESVYVTSEDSKESLEERQYKEAIRFDDDPDAGKGKNYIIGSVPTERKYRFFLKPSPTSDKLHFNKIKGNIEEQGANPRLMHDEFDNVSEKISALQGLKKPQPILDEYGKNYLKDQTVESNKSLKYFKIALVILFLFIFIGLLSYTYINI